jgi:predicted phage terminase large subunit-like protein
MATRWTLDDLTGYILNTNENSKRVKILKFPAISEANKALHPQLHPLYKLTEQKEAMTAEEWSALYQQEPVLAEGNVIKTAEFLRYKELPPLLYTKIFADTAMTIKKSSDYTVFGLFGYDYNGNCYLIDLWRGKWESPEVLKTAQSLWDKFTNAADLPYPKPRSLAIENKANGIHIIQEFERRKIPVEVLEPKAKDYKGNFYTADKVQRLMDILPYISAGRFYIPADEIGHKWLKDFLIECQAFTRDNSHKHDDQIDVLIYALKEMIEAQWQMPQSFSQGLRQRRNS